MPQRRIGLLGEQPGKNKKVALLTTERYTAETSCSLPVSTARVATTHRFSKGSIPEKVRVLQDRLRRQHSC